MRHLKEKGYYHNRPPPVPILSQFNPVHASSSHYLKINFVPNSHPRHGLPSGFFPWGLPHQNPVCTSPVRDTFHLPANRILFDSINRILIGEVQMSQSPSLRSLLHTCYLVPLMPTYLPHHRTVSRKEFKTRSVSVTAYRKISCS